VASGTKVELLTGASNGSWEGQHWKVTTLDGTQYFLGRNRPPGWQEGKPETLSTWNAPVFGNNAGEPCFKAGDYAGSWCNQAWRWNLDYTVDPNGNAATYYYQQEKNFYGLNRNNTGKGTEYTAGGSRCAWNTVCTSTAEASTAPNRPRASPSTPRSVACHHVQWCSHAQPGRRGRRQVRPAHRRRIAGILNETGGYTGVAYSGQDCKPGIRMPEAPESDTMRCYGVSIDSIATGLRNGAINPANVPPVRLVNLGGTMHSLDHRRLLAFQQANVPIPYRMATIEEIQQVFVARFDTTTDGKFIQMSMLGRDGMP
jgi:hypothetical protein